MLCFDLFYMVAFVKERLGYDDSLDTFGAYRIGGTIVSILTGILAIPVVQAAYIRLIFSNVLSLMFNLLM